MARTAARARMPSTCCPTRCPWPAVLAVCQALDLLAVLAVCHAFDVLAVLLTVCQALDLGAVPPEPEKDGALVASAQLWGRWQNLPAVCMPMREPSDGEEASR